jgi:signal transduction histidine kinase
LNEIEAGRSNLPEELQERRRVLLGELKDRSLWFVRVRWWVPPTIVVGSLVARAVGVQLAVLPLLLVAVSVLVYNMVFRHWYRRFADLTARQAEAQLRRFTRWQVGCDYLAMGLVLHFTGGASSPFIFFLIFHIIFASILLKHSTAYWTAALVAAGVGLLFAAESFGWLPNHPLVYGGRPIGLVDQPFPLLVQWGLLAASLLISTFAICNIMEMVRQRIYRLADLSQSVIQLNAKLGSLNVIGHTIVSLRRLAPVLEVVCAELAKVMNVPGISVKLLDENGQHLQFAASCGLPETLTEQRVIEVQRSPLNRRILEGEPYVTGNVTEQDLFQLGEQLAAADIKSVLFVPLRREERVIGILGAYCHEPARFAAGDVDFLRLAAELAAIAIENARAYEAIENLYEMRERFMMRVAHNLRAPLAAMRSILEVLREGYLGDLNEKQREYVTRVDRRARTLTDLINELLLLAENQRQDLQLRWEPVDLQVLLGRLERTFREEAARKGLTFRVDVAANLPPLTGDADMIERMLENLVSNAIKYTPAGGQVRLTAASEGEALALVVRDTGIGIPAEAQPRLFSEFFRADNAKVIEEIGTGLGLAIVKEIVGHHGGRIMVESEENRGTCFTVHLPLAGPPLPGRKQHEHHNGQPAAQ